MTYSPIAHWNIFVSAYAQADLFGRLIIFSLIFLSLLCWLILVYKMRQMRHVSEISSRFRKALDLQKHELLQLDVDSLPKTLRIEALHPFFSIFQALQIKTIEILNKNLHFSHSQTVYLSSEDMETLENQTVTTISMQSKLLDEHLFILSTIVTLAPFLGLLGTVWGILITFSELQQGSAAGSSTAILGGLSTALVTTVLGLVIAIPALVAYNYLKTRLKTYISEMEDFSYQLLSTVELQYRKNE